MNRQVSAGGGSIDSRPTAGHEPRYRRPTSRCKAALAGGSGLAIAVVASVMMGGTARSTSTNLPQLEVSHNPPLIASLASQ